ncbi:MAG: T9SS type A sorting domain-containing protein [Bacteroidetes bacterium]|nr:T9SS type A sorting domain-containing protein [Bacteroidota bacterium]
MKKIFLLLLAFVTFEKINAQQNYCDFEGSKVIYFGGYSGILDSAFANPDPNTINPTTFCAKYIRDTVLFDNFKMYPSAKLSDVSPYATFTTLKIKMKLYTSAPVGSNILLQLGTKFDDIYPSGTHSEYTAVTTAQNAWQVISFNFFQIPTGSMTAPTDIDKIVVLFKPNTSGRDTIFFDDPTGPEIIVSGIPTENFPAVKLYQNHPNPAKEITQISFQVNTTSVVSLKLFDILGNSVSSLVNQTMKPGNYNIPVQTLTIPNGVYFYVLEANGIKKSLKMIVSN